MRCGGRHPPGGRHEVYTDRLHSSGWKSVKAHQCSPCGDRPSSNIRNFQTRGLHEHVLPPPFVIERNGPLRGHHLRRLPRSISHPLKMSVFSEFLSQICCLLSTTHRMISVHLGPPENATNNDINSQIENRHIQVNYPTGANSQFTYDGLNRCVKIVETTGSTKQFIWDQATICEARDGSGSVLNQYFKYGQTLAG